MERCGQGRRRGSLNCRLREKVARMPPSLFHVGIGIRPNFLRDVFSAEGKGEGCGDGAE